MNEAKPSIFTDSEFYDATFKNVDCRKQLLDYRTFERCIFSGCKFTEAQFENCTFRDCQFKNCNLHLMSVARSTFRDCGFKSCEATYVNWALASWSAKGLLHHLTFEECNASNSTFIGLPLRKLRMVGCICREVDFSESDLSEAVFHKTDLEGSRFGKCTLAKADFRGAHHYTISPLDCVLKGAQFSLPEAVALLAAFDIRIASLDESV